jgi:hypothetical protein
MTLKLTQDTGNKEVTFWERLRQITTNFNQNNQSPALDVRRTPIFGVVNIGGDCTKAVEFKYIRALFIVRFLVSVPMTTFSR